LRRAESDERFVRIATGIDPLPLQLELHRAAAAVGSEPVQRRTYPDTPHGRWSTSRGALHAGRLVNITTRRAEHRNVFWPAWGALPSLRPMVFGLMARVQAVELGSILITKLPAGGEILPHNDRGSWAPEALQHQGAYHGRRQRGGALRGEDCGRWRARYLDV
jgi:hypothetical protein